MHNPLEAERRHDNPMYDAEDYARDLAYGALLGEWPAEIIVDEQGDWVMGRFRVANFGRTPTQDQFRDKWFQSEERPPSFHVLASMGYLQFLNSDTKEIAAGITQARSSYLLTQKAFDLLSKPAVSPHIFISYSRKESSALALLVEARLRIAGANPDRIFVDRDIQGGERWQTILEEHIRNCDVLVLLLGPTTWGSEWVRQEVDWAGTDGKLVIPVCHNGMKIAQIPDERLKAYHGYDIEEETALRYETAINFILNSVGYRTF